MTCEFGSHFLESLPDFPGGIGGCQFARKHNGCFGRQRGLGEVPIKRVFRLAQLFIQVGSAVLQPLALHRNLGFLVYLIDGIQAVLGFFQFFFSLVDFLLDVGRGIHQPLHELSGLVLEFLVAKFFEPRFEFIDFLYSRRQLLELALVRISG